MSCLPLPPAATCPELLCSEVNLYCISVCCSGFCHGGMARNGSWAFLISYLGGRVEKRNKNIYGKEENKKNKRRKTLKHKELKLEVDRRIQGQ